MLRRVGCVVVECARVVNDCVVEKTYHTCWAVDASAMVAESIKVFLDGQFWLDPEIFGPGQVAFARGMDAFLLLQERIKLLRYLQSSTPFSITSSQHIRPKSKTYNGPKRFRSICVANTNNRL